MTNIEIALIVIGAAIFLIILKITVDWISICSIITDELKKWAESIRLRKNK